jgi:hypothetical protein
MEGQTIPLPRVTTLSLPAAFCAADHSTVYFPGYLWCVASIHQLPRAFILGNSA